MDVQPEHADIEAFLDAAWDRLGDGNLARDT
jgi:hypothetical protein